MKNIKMAMVLLCLGLSSCQKFVDIKKSSSQFFMTSPNDCQLLLDDYTKMNVGYPLDSEISADDYYISGTSYQIASIPQEEKDLYIWSSTVQRIAATPNWLNPYQVIYNANLVLETLNKFKGNADPVLLNTLRGSALFYRAYNFWAIAQLYAKPYSNATAAQDPGIPLRLSSDINDKSTRASVLDTYNRILQDLNEAISLLPNTSGIATRPNKAAAYAMLARTYLSMEDYANAGTSANEAIKLNNKLVDYNTISKTLAAPFTRYNNEVIFHSITYFKTSAPIAGPILAPGSTAANSCIARIDPALAASYASNDLRGQIFLKANTTTAILDDPSQPSGKKTVTLPDGSFRFTGNYEPASTFSTTLFTGLAVDEMYLIRSECFARAGQVTPAINDLNTLLNMRWKTGTYTNLSDQISADAALSTILVERRKELLMRGLRWTDLRRLNKDPRFKKDIIRQTKNVTFTGSVTVPVRTETVTMTNTLPANDPRYVLLIPKEVLDNSSIEQNLR